MKKIKPVVLILVFVMLLVIALSYYSLLIQAERASESSIPTIDTEIILE